MRILARPALTGLLAAIGIAALPALARAGAVCGTVRDGLTAQPVARAGAFLFHTTGVYTGLYAATDSSGDFCIAAVPAGTYDLQIRVDDYVAAVVRNLAVVEDQTGIRIDTLPPSRLRLAPPWPNPSRSRVTLGFGAEAPAPLELLVLDASGRLVRAWASSETAAGERTVTWDFRDRAGRPVAPGIYYVRLTDGREVVSRRIVFVP